jgi:uncharacterized membrane protein YagU involved in acid resistance
MKIEEKLVDVGVGLVAGLISTKITEQGQKALWALTPEEVKKREQAVRPGPPYRVAAEKIAALSSMNPTSGKLQQMGMALHYGSGMAWGTIYCLMRRAAGMESLGAGIAAGTSMSIILDELVTPAFGFSAPDREYPPTTHLRGFLGHLVYGTTLAASAEALYGLVAHATESDS